MAQKIHRLSCSSYKCGLKLKGNWKSTLEVIHFHVLSLGAPQCDHTQSFFVETKKKTAESSKVRFLAMHYFGSLPSWHLLTANLIQELSHPEWSHCFATSKRSCTMWFVHLVRMPARHLPGEALWTCPIGRKHQDRPWTHWREIKYLSWLGKCLSVTLVEVKEVAGEREVWGPLFRPLHPQSGPR